jgi:hypothetical protein
MLVLQRVAAAAARLQQTGSGQHKSEGLGVDTGCRGEGGAYARGGHGLSPLGWMQPAGGGAEGAMMELA